ncbi:peptidase S8/S53 domain-containing protein [Trichoderma chlorosporum]
MRAPSILWTPLCAVAVTLVELSLAEHVIHERSVESTNNWVKLGSINQDGLLPVRIGLTQRNLDLGHALLMERSDPSSPKYGQHMTRDEVNDLFAPHEDSAAAVHSWLEAEGIKLDRVSRSENRQWVQFHARVSELEKLLNTTYDMYENTKTGVRQIGTDEYSIPADLKSHIDYITPGTARLQVSGDAPKAKFRRQVKRNEPSDSTIGGNPWGITNNCSEYITPRCIRNMYNIPLGNSSIKGNELGIYEQQPYNQTELNLFFEYLAPHIPPNFAPLFSSIDGAERFPNKSVNVGEGEAMLDITCAFPIVYPQEVRIYNVDDAFNQENPKMGYFNTFLDAIDSSYCNRTAFNITGDSPEFDPTYPDPGGYTGERMCGVFKPTNVISISWSPEEQERSVNYDRRQCSEWMKLGLQGVTVLGATGDFGVAGKDGECITDANGNQTIFNPLALTNCPYVLAVGETQLAPGYPDGEAGHEIAASGLLEGFLTYTFSSGGFSNIYPTPEWQKSAVDKYFEENPTPYKFYNTTNGENIGVGGGVFNRGGRGFPDVSAVGYQVMTLNDGFIFFGGGTSAATPIVASMLTLINEERLKANMPTLGFVTPALYANPSIMNDVTVGNSPGCGTPGFYTAKGWDPVTGLGTPDYPKMLEYLMTLGSKGE